MSKRGAAGLPSGPGSKMWYDQVTNATGTDKSLLFRREAQFSGSFGASASPFPSRLLITATSFPGP